jgi:hypothetical protein
MPGYFAPGDHNFSGSFLKINITFNTIIHLEVKGGKDMSNMTSTVAFLILIFLSFQASAQGYMGTVSTGTGIIAPISVGSGTIIGANVGATATQANLTGAWSLELKDSLIKHLVIEAFQNQDVILGQGDMTLAGAVQKAVVSGSVASGKMIVFVSTIDGSVVYRLDLISSSTSLSGNYDAYTSNGSSWSGTVTGTMDLAADQRSSTILGGGSSPAASTGAYAGSSVAETVERNTYISYDGMTTTSGDTTIGANYG